MEPETQRSAMKLSSGPLLSRWYEDSALKEAMTKTVMLCVHAAERDHIRRTSSRIPCSNILSRWLYLQWQRSAHSTRSMLGPKGKSSLQDAARAESVHRMLFLAFSSSLDPSTGVFFCHGLHPASASQVSLHAVQLLLPSLMVSRPFSDRAAMLCSSDGALACLVFAGVPVELNAVVHLLASWSAAR